jgi:hypothetical protein
MNVNEAVDYGNDNAEDVSKINLVEDATFGKVFTIFKRNPIFHTCC